MIDCFAVNLTKVDVAAVQHEDFIRAAAAAALMLQLISLAAGRSVGPGLSPSCRLRHFFFIRASCGSCFMFFFCFFFKSSSSCTQVKNSEDGSFGTVDVWDTKTDRPSDPVASGGRRPRFYEDVILAMDEWMITIIL